MIDVQYFETAIAASGTKDGCRQICWFINGTHPTASPQNAIPWECLECFDGTTRDVPGGGSLANLPAGHLWKTDAVTTLPQNAWATFRSPGGVSPNKIILYARAGTFSSFYYSMDPLDNWVVGTGTDSDAGDQYVSTDLLLGSASGGGATPNAKFTNTIDRFFAVLLDGGTLTLMAARVTGETDVKWGSIGEFNSLNTAADDPYPFIFPRNLNTPSMSAGGHWFRLSPIDNTTLISVSSSPRFDETFDVAAEYNDLGVDYVDAVDLYANQAGHRFHMGCLRNVGAGPSTLLANRATAGVDGTDYQFSVWGKDPSGTNPRVIMRWPPGTALPGGHTIISDARLPPELLPPEEEVEVPVEDLVPPVIDQVDPPTLTSLLAIDPVTFRATDSSGSLLVVFIAVLFPDTGEHEVIYNGDQFSPRYKSLSSKTPVANGAIWRVRRVSGWPSQPTIQVKVFDLAGNTAILVIT